MKMARVIRFTGRIDAMSKFYGEVLALKQVTNEEGWREFAAGCATIALHSGPSSLGARVRRLSSTPRMSRPCGKRWWSAARVLVRYGREKSFVFATARTWTAIPFNCRTAKIEMRTLPESPCVGI